MKKLLLLFTAVVIWTLSPAGFKASAQDPEFTEFSSIAELNKPENDGKLVALNFPVNTLLQLNGVDNSAANGYDNYIYGRDMNGNPIKITTIGTSAATLTTWINFGFDIKTDRKYALPNILRGKFLYNGGINPELRIADGAEGYDYTSLIPNFTINIVYKNESNITSAYSAPNFATYPDYVSELKPEYQNCRVLMRNLTYEGLTDNVYTLRNSDGVQIQAKKIFDQFNMPSGLTLTEGETYTFEGIVEYDAESKTHFLAPITAWPTIKGLDFSTETLTGSTEYTGEKDPEADYEVTCDTPNGTLAFNIDWTSLAWPGKPQNNVQFYLYDENDPAGNLMEFANTTKTNVSAGKTTLSISASKISYYKDGAYFIKIVGLFYETVTSPATKNTLLGMTEPILVKIHDNYAAPKFGSIEEFLNYAKTVTPEQLEACKGAILTSESVMQVGDYMVHHVCGEYLVMSGIDDPNAERALMLKYNNAKGTGWERASTTNLATDGLGCYYKASKWFWRRIKAGDGIATVAGLIINENGNTMIDLSNTEGNNSRFKSYGASKGTSQNSTYQALFDGASYTSFKKPSETTLTEADLNKIVSIRNLKVKADGENCVALMATEIPFAFNYLTTEEKATEYKTFIASASADDAVQLKALVMSDGKGGVVLEVMEIEQEYAQELNVCYHEGHDSYFENQEFDPANKDRFVSMLGVKIVRSAASPYTYTAKLGTDVELTNIETVMGSNLSTNLTNQLDAAADDGTRTTKVSYNITGTLHVADDGALSIEVGAVKMNPAPSKNLLPYGFKVPGLSAFKEFCSYSVPVFEHYNAAGNATVLAYPTYRIFYKTLKVTEDNKDADETELAALFEAIEEKEYDPETIDPFDGSYWIQARTCSPGQTDLIDTDIVLIEKISVERTSLADAVENVASFHHYRNPLRVAAINADSRFMVLTDGTTLIAARAGTAISSTLPVEIDGINSEDYIDEVVLRHADATNNRQYFEINTRYDSQLYTPIKTIDAPEQEIALPEAADMAGFASIADAHAKYVSVTGAKIAKEGEDYILTLPGDGSLKLPVTAHLGYDLEATSEDAEYNINGYVFKRVAIPQPEATAANALADAADYEYELWATDAIVRRATATPVITVTGAESVEDGKAVTVEDVTVTIACDDAEAAIEYSLDGTTWQAYPAAGFTIDKSCTVSARALLADMLMSEIAKMEIVREYISDDVTIDPAEMAGYTAVVIRPSDPSMKPDAFKIYYTLDGTEPTTASQEYDSNKMLELEAPCTVKAIIVENGKRPSAVAEEQINVVSGNVTISVRKGNGESFVTIAPASDKHLAANRTIYYTLDGTTPDATSEKYTGEIRLTEDATVTAYMKEDGKQDGDLATEDVTVTSTPTEPTDPDDPKDPTNPDDPKDPTEPTDPDDPSAIDSVGADQTASVSVSGNSIIAPEGSQAFDLTGRQVRMDGLRPGIYIVRTPDGKAVKLRINN